MAYTENLITIEQQVSNHLLLFHLFSYKYQRKELYLQNEKESNIWLNSKKKQEKNLSLVSSEPIERKREFEKQAQKEFVDMRKRGVAVKKALWNLLTKPSLKHHWNLPSVPLVLSINTWCDKK